MRRFSIEQYLPDVARRLFAASYLLPVARLDVQLFGHLVGPTG
ncbi:MAG: hypothetical protein V4721_03635 [Bacteroidota bacterium]